MPVRACRKNATVDGAGHGDIAEPRGGRLLVPADNTITNAATMISRIAETQGNKRYKVVEYEDE